MRDHGTKLAYVRWSGRWTLALAAWTASGCLVTSTKQFPAQADVPATLVARRSAFPVDEIIRPGEIAPEDDGGLGSPQELRLVVDVYDPDVRQELEYRFLITNGASRPRPPECPIITPELRGCGPIPVTGAVDRTLEIPVPIADLGDPTIMPRCVRLELFVSDAFDGLSVPPGSVRSDIVWWADVSPPGTPAALTNCPSRR